jgi:hypothetical protein
VTLLKCWLKAWLYCNEINREKSASEPFEDYSTAYHMTGLFSFVLLLFYKR